MSPNVLVYSDGPSVPTGFGTVVKNIFLPLFARGVLAPERTNFYAINYQGEPHELMDRCRQFPANIGLVRDPDPYGRDRFAMETLNGKWPVDLLFVLQDHFTVARTMHGAPFLPQLVAQMRQQVAAGQRPPFKVIYYCPIDGTVLWPEWVSWLPQTVDYLVAYMDWSQRMLLDMLPELASRTRRIYHGTNPELYYPLPEAERREYRERVFGIRDDTPLIVYVQRNQPRKAPDKALQVFARVRQLLGGRPRLYMHLNAADPAGYQLGRVGNQLRLPDSAVMFPQNFSEGHGVSVAELNRVYNAADLVLVTSRGEGWGLSCSEAMCAGKLVVAPDHTSFSEMLADDRGVLVPPLPGWADAVQPLDNDQFRPMVDVEAMAERCVWALTHPAERDALAQRGRAWAMSQAWSGTIADQWQALFTEAAAALRPAPPPPVQLRAVPTSAPPPPSALRPVAPRPFAATWE